MESNENIKEFGQTNVTDSKTGKKIQIISKNLGLSYNNDNIKIVTNN